MAKRIPSNPIIALDNWRPMAFFFIVLGKTIPVKSTPNNAIFSKKALVISGLLILAKDKICNCRKMKNYNSRWEIYLP